MKKTISLKSILSFVLCVTLLCTCIPAFSVAAEAAEDVDEVYVNNVLVTAENEKDVLGDGSVSYDATQKVLTLCNASIIKTAEYSKSAVAGIYASSDLTIHIEETNVIRSAVSGAIDNCSGIYVEGDLTIEGPGIITCTTGSASKNAYGLYASGSVCLKQDGDITIQAGVAPNSYGIFAGASIEFCALMSSWRIQGRTAALSKAPTSESWDKITVSATNDLDFYNSKDYPMDQFLSRATEYKTVWFWSNDIYVWINGVKITHKNCDDVFGDGTVSFDADMSILYLNNATITSGYCEELKEDAIAGIYTRSWGSMEIFLKGNNVIDLRNCKDKSVVERYGIYAGEEYSIDFEGDGNLSVFTGDNTTSKKGRVSAFCAGEYTYFTGSGDYRFEAGYAGKDGSSLGIDSERKVYLGDSKFIEGEEHGIYIQGETAATNLEISDNTHDLYSSKTLEGDFEIGMASSNVQDLKRLKYISTEIKTYDTYVAGILVTSNNAWDILGDGSAYFNSIYNDLVLCDATLKDLYVDESEKIGAAIFTLRDLYIEFRGNCVIDLTEGTPDGLDICTGIFIASKENNLSFNTEDALTINMNDTATNSYGVYTAGDIQFSYRGCIRINALAENGIAVHANECWGETYTSDSYRDVELRGGKMAMEVKKFYGDSGLDFFASESLTGELRNVKDLVYDYENPCDYSQFKVFTIKEEIPAISIAGIKVNNENCHDILNDGGKVSYDDGIVALSDAYITEGSITKDGYVVAIDSEFPNDIYFYLIGDNVIDLREYSGQKVAGIFANGEITFDGYGSLTILLPGGESSIGIKTNKDVYIGDAFATVSVSIEDGKESIGISCDNFNALSNRDVEVSIGEAQKSYGILCEGDLVQKRNGNIKVTSKASGDEVAAVKLGGMYDCMYSYGWMQAIASGEKSYGFICNGDINFDRKDIGSESYIFQGGTQGFLNNKEDATYTLGTYALKAKNQISDDIFVETPVFDDLSSYQYVEFQSKYFAYNQLKPVCTVTTAPYTDTITFSEKPESVSLNAYDVDIGMWSHFELVSKFTPETNAVTFSQSNLSRFSGQYVYIYADALYKTEDGDSIHVYTKLTPMDLCDPINYVDLYLDTVVPGNVPSQTVECWGGDKRLETKIVWYEVTEDGLRALDKGENFVIDSAYQANVFVTYPEGVEYGESTYVSVSEGTLLKEKIQFDSEKGELFLPIYFAPTSFLVEAAYITTKTYPQVGQRIGDMKWNCACYCRGDDNFYSPAIYSITPVWTCCEGDTYIEEYASPVSLTDKFLPGHTYSVQFSLILKEGYQWKNVSIYMDDEGKYSTQNGGTVQFSQTYGPFVRDVEKIEFVSDIPHAGQTYDELFVSQKDDINWDYYTVRIKDADGEEFYDPLEAGKTYTMVVECGLKEYEMIWDDLEVIVNGQTLAPESVSIVDRNTFRFEIQCDILEDTQQISVVDISISQPRVGKMVKDVSISYNQDQLEYVFIPYWAKRKVGETTFWNMYPDDVFEEGYEYIAELGFETKPGFALEDGWTFLFNGEETIPDGGDNISAYVYLDYDAVLPQSAIELSASEMTYNEVDLEDAGIPFTAEYSFTPNVGEGKSTVLHIQKGTDEWTENIAENPKAFSIDLTKYTEDVAGEYTVFVSAYDEYGDLIESNEVKITVEKEIVYGDANEDEILDMKDVLLIRKYLAKVSVTINLANADANGDGEIDLKDVLALREYLALIRPVLGPTD